MRRGKTSVSRPADPARLTAALPRSIAERQVFYESVRAIAEFAQSETLQRIPQLQRLLEVVERLRAPDGCPWDREQTTASMARHLLEEAFEAAEALEDGDDNAAREELGDVLMNVVMIARIASERGAFDLEAVAQGIADKLVRRHPHVFGDACARNAEQVLSRWEEIKRTEAGEDAPRRSVLAGLPRALPALQKALRIGEKAARVGFDWPSREGPRRKLDEEIEELDAALAAGNFQAIEHEVGDVLFAVANLARHAGVDPERALRRTIDRFAERFRHVEEALGDRLGKAGLDEMETLWRQAKERTDDPAS